MTKSWLISLAALPLVVWLFLRVPQKIIPQLLNDGTEQIIVQWREALTAYKKDHGKFPEQQEGLNFEQSMVECLTGNNPDKKRYLNPATVRISHTLPVDGWDTSLYFDPLSNGDMAHIRSSGPDGVLGTPDDIDSKNLRQRNLAAPDDPTDDRAKSKAKTATKNSDTEPEPAP
jgi:Type II secretion system (T2SS), protein G